MITQRNMYWKLNVTTNISEDDQNYDAKVQATYEQQEWYKNQAKKRHK